jgi:hypothetical protein
VAVLKAPASGQLNIWAAYTASSSTPVSIIPTFTLNAPTAAPIKAPSSSSSSCFARSEIYMLILANFILFIINF